MRGPAAEVRFAVSEAVRGLHPVHVFQTITVISVLVMLGVFTGLSAAGAIEREAVNRANGSLIWIATAAEGATIDSRRCVALSEVRGVDAAGGIAPVTASSWRAFDSGAEIPTAGVTVGALEVWDDGALYAGPTIGSEISRLGLAEPGQVLVHPGAEDAQIRIWSTLSRSVANERLNSLLLIPTYNTMELAECWVRMSPGAAPFGPDVLGAGLMDASVQVVPFTASDPSGFTPSQQWRDFQSYEGWLLAAAGVAAISAIFAFSRKPQLAVYRVMGASRSVIVAIIAVEAVLISTLGAAVALSVSISLVGSLNPYGALPSVVAAVSSAVALAALAGLGLSVVSATLVSGGSIATHLRDR